MASIPEAAAPVGVTSHALGRLWRNARASWLGMTASVSKLLEAEGERCALWLVVFFGAGIAGYFSLPFEPSPIWALLSVVAVLLLLLRAGARGPVERGLLSGLLALALGFVAADVRTWQVAGPVLERAYGPSMVEGVLRDLTARADGTHRLVLDVAHIEDLAAEHAPRRVRLSLRVKPEGLAPGDRLRLRARLMPPAAPAAPGAYDFARRVYFQGIGAVGFVYGRPEPVVDTARRGLGAEARRVVWTIRQRIAARAEDAIPGPSGAVAAALMVGERGLIPEPTVTALRNAGLAHMLAISGLHMSLIALGLFAVVRLVLAAIEPLALRAPTKKWAALIALCGGAAYLVLSGGSLPTQRAFVMLSLVLVAVILDRRALTMRNVALAAALILILAPESLLEVGFQMSFAAVVTLVATYELRPLPMGADAGSLFGRLKQYVLALGLTTLVASAAIAPFAMFHFQVIQHYSLIANLAAMPILGFVVMPAASLAFVLMPFGLDGPLLAVMGRGLDIIIAVAGWVSALPGAVQTVDGMPGVALGLVGVGGLWLCLWRLKWRLFGFAPIAAAVLIAIASRGPDLLVAGDGKTIAARDDRGELAIIAGNPKGYTASVWLRRDGVADAALGDHAASAALRCDPLGCVFDLDADHRLAVSEGSASLADDCARAKVVFAREPVRGQCIGPDLVIDRFDLWRNGAHAVWLDGASIRVRHVRAARGVRPWAPDPARFAKR